MNEVYIIIEDNGDCYEDYSEWIDKVFIDEESAKKYIKIKKAKWRRIEKKDDMANIHGFRLEKHKLVGDVNKCLQSNWNELKKGLQSLFEFDEGVVSKDYLEYAQDTLNRMQELEQWKDD